MAPTRFTFTEDGSVTSDDGRLAESLAGVLSKGLLLGKIPRELPLVGHCQIGSSWCVFGRDGGEAGVHGVVIPEDQYAKAEFDPFVVAATYLRGRSVREAVREGPIEPPPSGLARDSDGPLRAAYGGFLSGTRARRRGTYLSVLPPRLAPQISPLSCLFVTGPGAPEEVFPLPPTKALASPADVPTRGANRDATRTLPKVDRPPKDAPPPPARPVDDRPATVQPNPSWKSVTLDRGGDAVAAARPADPGPTRDDDIKDRLSDLESLLSRTRRTLFAGFAIALLIGLAAGLWLHDRIGRAAASSVSITTMATGLGIEAPPEEIDAAIEAHLRDLSTVAVQSGAWQSVLERRGVDRDIFLDRLVDLSSRQKELLSLADANRALAALASRATALTSLAKVSDDLEKISANRADLIGISEQRQRITSLVDVADALTTLAPLSDELTALAASAQDLESLASNAGNLTALAGSRRDLEAVAEQRGALGSLAANATALRTLAEHGADLMVFWERYGTAVQDLARQQESLSSLAERHRSISRLVEESPALYELAARADELLAMIESPPPAAD